MAVLNIEYDIQKELSLEEQEVAMEFIRFLKDNHFSFHKDNGAYWKDKIYYWVKHGGDNMRFEVMELKDIDLIIPLYIEYYNNHEDGCWTEETAKRRIRQVLMMDGSYSLMMKDIEGEVCGFVMGYYKQYDDIVGYTLEEILVAHEYQNKGYGRAFLAEVEARVKETGASYVELQAVKDEMHERYYGKAGYSDAKNFVMKRIGFPCKKITEKLCSSTFQH